MALLLRAQWPALAPPIALVRTDQPHRPYGILSLLERSMRRLRGRFGGVPFARADLVSLPGVQYRWIRGESVLVRPLRRVASSCGIRSAVRVVPNVPLQGPQAIFVLRDPGARSKWLWPLGRRMFIHEPGDSGCRIVLCAMRKKSFVTQG